jgi:hypothetical protein
MPDKWEFPWFAAWDHAFQLVTLAEIDPDLAKAQAILFLREWYMHPSGKLPAYEFALDDVSPPVHAWACWLPDFGGNSNWRGPVWIPVNYRLIEALQRYHHFYGDAVKVEMPMLDRPDREPAAEVRPRLTAWCRDPSARCGRRRSETSSARRPPGTISGRVRPSTPARVPAKPASNGWLAGPPLRSCCRARG